jgi:anti-sigma-K factor RskA
VNIQEYISSGIIESYVLGLASPEERAEFERMCLQYPELVAARTEFELTLEKQLLRDAADAPRNVKEKVMSLVNPESSINQTKIITMQSSNANRGSSSMRWVAAASVILFLGFGFLAYKYYSQVEELKTSNENLAAEKNAADSASNQLAAENKLMKELIENPNVAAVNMVPTTPGNPSASIYWDSTSSNVYMVVKNMPKLPSDKQYQLWALIDGKPKDLGLFDIGDKKVILKMNNTQKADAFAITIENRGNTGGPNLQQLQNMGKAKL